MPTSFFFAPMTVVLLAFALFFSLVQLVVIADIVCSWISLLVGRMFRPALIAAVTDPAFALVGTYLPTRLGVFDFSAAYVILGCEVIVSAIVAFDPSVLLYLPR